MCWSKVLSSGFYQCIGCFGSLKVILIRLDLFMLFNALGIIVQLPPSSVLGLVECGLLKLGRVSPHRPVKDRGGSEDIYPLQSY